MAIGCCGKRSVSLQGLLAEADSYPASSPAGRAARAKLAYGIAAGKAAQAGNRPAYERAMRGLSGLGLFTSTSDPHIADRVRAAITPVTTTPPVTLSQLSGYANLILTFSNAITNVAAIVPGSDANAIAVTRTVISWIQALISGTAPRLPTLDANTLNGFVTLCSAQGVTVKGLIDLAFGAIIAGLTTAASPAPIGSGDANAGRIAVQLTTIQTRLDNMFDGICAAVREQVPPATVPADAPAPAPTAPQTQTTSCWNGQQSTQTWDPASSRWGAPTPPCPAPPPALGLETGAGGCVAGVRGGGPGSYNMIAPGGIADTAGRPVPGTAGTKSCTQCHAPATFVPGVVNPATGLWATPPRCVMVPRPGGGGGGGGGGSSSGGLLKVAVPAAAALWWFFR